MSDQGICRRALLALAATAVLLLGPGTAVADTPISSSGTVGAHHLNDTRARPGVRCLYQDGAGGGDEDLYLLTVRPPVIFAANATRRRDSQLVGWRAIVQRKDPGSARFVTVQQSGLHTAWAWDDTAAVLYARDVAVTSQYGSSFRVRILMFWYSPAGGGGTTGTATSEVDWYRKIYRSTDFGDDIRTLAHSCPDYYPG